jgi:spermidine synthase
MSTAPPLRHSSALGVIKLVRKRATGALTYVQKGGNQSEADRAGVSLSTYIHALYSLVMQSGARRILMIGCGGGTLGTMLARAGKQITIVDIDAASFKIARRHFHLPRTVDCHVADGLAFVAETRRRFDMVIVDAFIGETVPPQFTSDAFCVAARRCLRPDGALFMNVCLDGRRDRTADKIAARFFRHGWRVRILDQRSESERNAIVLAGNAAGLHPPRLLVTPEAEVERIRKELRGMGFRRRARVPAS